MSRSTVVAFAGRDEMADPLTDLLPADATRADSKGRGG